MTMYNKRPMGHNSSELNNHNSDNQLYALPCTPFGQFSTEDLY